MLPVIGCNVTRDCNTTNLMKHLTVHGINLRAESCSVFDLREERTAAVLLSACKSAYGCYTAFTFMD